MPDGTTSRGERLLRLPDVLEKTSLSRSTVYRRIQEGTFPAPLELGPGTVRWRLSDVEGWIAALPARAGK